MPIERAMDSGVVMPAPAAEMRRWLEEQLQQCHRLGMHARATAFLDALAHMEWLPGPVTWHPADTIEESPMADTTGDELETRFTYHAPKGDQPSRYETIRGAGLELARLIDSLTPASREQSLAMTHLEQAVMWANAAIARRE